MQKVSPLTICLLFLTFGTLAHAAEPPPPPEATDQFASQSERFRKNAAALPAKKEEKPEIVVQKEEEGPIEDTGPFFMIQKIKLSGNTIFGESVFETYVQMLENRRISFGDLKALSRAITNYYRAHGYSTSRAFVPPQTVENQTAEIKIVEGGVDKVYVEGNKYFSAQVYQRSIKFGKERVFRYQDLERSLYFLNQKPDRSAKAYLVAGQEPTKSDIILKAEDKNPFHAGYEYNNHGTKLTHRGRHLIRMSDNNAFGIGDIVSGSATVAEQAAFDGGSFGYTHFMDESDTILSFQTSYINSLLVKNFKPLNVRGNSYNYVPSITHSFIAEPLLQLDGYAGLEIKDLRTTVSGTKLNFDRMRTLVIGPRLTTQDASGRTFVSTEIHWGIGGLLGGSEARDTESSRVGAGGDFRYYTANVARFQKMPDSSFLIARAGGQISEDKLTSLEQFHAGGANSVRGYPESDSAGDYGYNFSFEYNFLTPFMPRNWVIPMTPKKWSDALRWVGFLDGGKTYLKNRASDASVKDRFLLGTGLGIRFNWNSNFSLECDLGFPIGDKSTDENQKQVHLEVKGGF